MCTVKQFFPLTGKVFATHLQQYGKKLVAHRKFNLFKEKVHLKCLIFTEDKEIVILLVLVLPVGLQMIAFSPSPSVLCPGQALCYK